MLDDDELDEYVASLLKRQAEKQSTAYSSIGYRAFLKNAAKDGPVGKPNTRFLKNIVRDIDGHNAALARKEEKESRGKLQELRKKDGEKMHGFKEEVESGKRARDEDWRVRRERERSRSPARRRYDDRRDEEQGRKHKSQYSSDWDHRDSDRKTSRDRRKSGQDEDEHGNHRHRRSRHEHRSRRDSDDGSNRRHRSRRDSTERSRRSSPERRHSRRRDEEERHSSRKYSHRESRKPSYFSESKPKTKKRRTGQDNKLTTDRQSSSDESPSEHRHYPTRSTSTKDAKFLSLSPSPPASLIGPLAQTVGPEFLHHKGRGELNGGTLDAKFSESYNPRIDVQNHQSDTVRSEGEDDWGLALRALRERQSYVLSGAMTERLSETQSQTSNTAWPTYSKGEREWDKGKVVLPDGSVGVKVWGVDKSAL